MKHTLQEHIARLGGGTHRSAYILQGTDIDMRKLCKAFRERCRRYIGSDHYTVLVWAKVESGVLLMCGGSLIVAAILSNFLGCYNATGSFTESELYRGPGRKVFMEVVTAALEHYSTLGRSYGASR